MGVCNLSHNLNTFEFPFWCNFYYRFRQQARRGRTNHPDGGEAPPADDPAAGKEGGEGGEDGEGDVPDWCNPTKEMGAWLNFMKIRVICGERGATDFGPYGGIPSEEEGGEEAAE